MNLLAEVYVQDEELGAFYVEYKQMLFPDGQPHITLVNPIIEKHVTVTMRIKSPLDLVELLLLKETLDQGDNEVDLNIAYLMGARMDRRIDDRQPFTLKVIANVIKAGAFRNIRIMDPHSDVALALLDAEAVYPTRIIGNLLKSRFAHKTVIVAPDAGATRRVETIMRGTGSTLPVVQGLKHRDPQSGKLSGFGVANPEFVEGKTCLIIDDICDGGGTFQGLAEVLRAEGATGVDLFVTHGIFSRGTRIVGIDNIVTTDSYRGWGQGDGFTVHELTELDWAW